MLQYSAVPQTEGAPLRTVTVKDVISDLPPIQNGHSEIESQYSGTPHCITSIHTLGHHALAFGCTFEVPALDMSLFAIPCISMFHDHATL